MRKQGWSYLPSLCVCECGSWRRCNTCLPPALQLKIFDLPRQLCLIVSCLGIVGLVVRCLACVVHRKRCSYTSAACSHAFLQSGCCWQRGVNTCVITSSNALPSTLIACTYVVHTRHTRGLQPRVPPKCVLVVTQRYHQRYYQ